MPPKDDQVTLTIREDFTVKKRNAVTNELEEQIDVTYINNKCVGFTVRTYADGIESSCETKQGTKEIPADIAELVAQKRNKE